MTPHDLILEYVDAARAVERWTARAEQLKCPLEHLHARGKRLLPAGSTCRTCRDRIDALHRLSDARERRNRALAEQHQFVRTHEIEQHALTRERRRVRKEPN